MIRTEAERTVREYAAQKGLDFEITIPHVRDVEITGDAAPVVRASMAGKQIRGVSAPVRVEFLDAGGSVIRGIHLVAQVRTYAIVVVAARDIQRGDTLRTEDIQLKRADVSMVRNYFTRTGDAAGTLACQSLKAGTTLRPGMVKAEPVIHRGDRVTMKAVVGNVALAAEGIAREDGGRGECIRVFNTQTRVSVICTVIDAQTVTIGKTGG